MEVSNKKESENSTEHFYKLCKRIECLGHPKKVDYDGKASIENVEVFSSFRPSVSATFRAEKLEQITLSSESDSEPEETGRRSSSFSEGGLNFYTEVPYEVPTGFENTKIYNSFENAKNDNNSNGEKSNDERKGVNPCLKVHGSDFNSESGRGEYWEDHRITSATGRTTLPVQASLELGHDARTLPAEEA